MRLELDALESQVNKPAKLPFLNDMVERWSDEMFSGEFYEIELQGTPEYYQITYIDANSLPTDLCHQLCQLKDATLSGLEESAKFVIKRFFRIP